MFTMQAAIPIITQAACLYTLPLNHYETILPAIVFEYTDQNGNVTELTDLEIPLQGKTMHEILMGIGHVIPTVINRFHIDQNTRYVMVWKIDSSTQRIRVTLKTAYHTVAMDMFRRWEESYNAIPPGTTPWGGVQ